MPGALSNSPVSPLQNNRSVMMFCGRTVRAGAPPCAQRCTMGMDGRCCCCCNLGALRDLGVSQTIRAPGRFITAKCVWHSLNETLGNYTNRSPHSPFAVCPPVNTSGERHGDIIPSMIAHTHTNTWWSTFPGTSDTDRLTDQTSPLCPPWCVRACAEISV